MTIKALRSAICRHAAGTLLAVMATSAQAQLATNISVDIRALSMGNAVTADPPGVSAVHYNPAGLAYMPGRQIDYQFLGLTLGVESQFHAPEGYNMFGYSDDPVVCADAESNPSSFCNQFVDRKSEVEGVSLYVPVLDQVVDLPPGPLFAPLMAFSVRPAGSKITFGNQMYAPMAAGLYRNDNDPGNFLGQRVALERVTLLSPSFGYQVNDEWAIGAGVHFPYMGMHIETDFRSPNELLGFTRLIDESICAPFKGQGSNVIVDLFLFGICNAEEGIGPFKSLANLNVTMEQRVSPTLYTGLMWRPNDDFSWGMMYQAESRMHMHGKFKITYEKGTQGMFNAIGGSPTGQILLAIFGLPNFIPKEDTGQVSIDLTYPAHFQTGISWRVVPKVKWNFDIGWTDYDEWDAFNLKFDRQLAVLQLARLLAPGTTPTSLRMPLGYSSPWSWGTGFEFSLSDRLVTRIGYEPRKSAIPEDKRSTLVPINEAKLYGLGLGYQLDKDSQIDLTLAYLISKDSIPANTSTNLNATGLDNIVYNPYAGLDAKTKASITIMGLAYRTRW